MASVLEASAHVPEPGWELLSPKHGVVEGSSCRGTRPKGTRPKAQAGALLFFLQEGQEDTVGLLHWLCPDLRSRELQELSPY